MKVSVQPLLQHGLEGRIGAGFDDYCEGFPNLKPQRCTSNRVLGSLFPENGDWSGFGTWTSARRHLRVPVTLSENSQRANPEVSIIGRSPSGGSTSSRLYFQANRTGQALVSEFWDYSGQILTPVMSRFTRDGIAFRRAASWGRPACTRRRGEIRACFGEWRWHAILKRGAG